MSPGPRPTPTAKRKLEGNPSRRPLPKEPDLPEPTAATYDGIPDELVANEFARLEWMRLAPMLRKAHIVTEADRAVLLALCQQWSVYRRSLAKVDESGMVVTSPSGYPMPNPYIGISNKAFQNCLKMWMELGITPAARTKVEATTGEGVGGHDDEFAEFDEPDGKPN